MGNLGGISGCPFQILTRNAGKKSACTSTEAGVSGSGFSISIRAARFFGLPVFSPLYSKGLKT